MHHRGPECHVKRLYANFKVKVTVVAHIIKIGLFLLYLLSYLSVCTQIQFDCTSLEAGMSREMIDVLS